MIGIGWMGGLFYTRLSSTNLRRIFGVGVIFCLSGLTWIQLPVWKNELSLWENAVKQAPRAWFAWACYGEALQRSAERIKEKLPEQSRRIEEQSKRAFEEAFKLGVPTESASNVLFLLAKAEHRLGEKSKAADHAKKAIELNSNLTAPWRVVTGS
jgi:tetratricopeptide (TPR) repeat protein